MFLPDQQTYALLLISGYRLGLHYEFDVLQTRCLSHLPVYTNSAVGGICQIDHKIPNLSKEIDLILKPGVSVSVRYVGISVE